jgi:predicted nucleic acid-binding protein
MTVVSDTSPINYLILIELQDLLPNLLDRVLIPDAVHRELQSSGAPYPIRRFLAEGPAWLEVRSSPEIAPALRHLDAGERETISLALSVGADLVLFDEGEGTSGGTRTGTSSVWNARRHPSCC